ncbi:SusC/RagA family TonB-linked outer membrane protein [Mucilaginibacter paludis]|nr:SusC/RagA family TonB-linked outer membrane protein [Mucilaginibacter paludis]
MMKLTALFIVLFCFRVAGGSFAQTVTLSARNAPAEKVFQEIKKQTGYMFWYKSDLLQDFKPVTIQVDHASLQDALDLCFKDQSLTFTIVENTNTIVVSRKETGVLDKIKKIFSPSVTIRGTVKGESLPLSGASVLVKRLGKGTFTNEKGEFSLEGLEESDILVISFIGYEKQEVKISGTTGELQIQLKTSISALDEIHVLAYGQRTSQRLTTGSSTRIGADVIDKQATADPISAIQARVPGLLITNNSGLPGAAVTVQIRGISTLNLDGAARNPLYIVDGVPFTAGSLSTLTNNGIYPGSVESPFKSIDPSSIESIEVLKDADATAIYGTRGANGVILITTKRGKKGKVKINADAYTSISRVPHFMDMLNTQQYLAARREAAINSGRVINTTSYPDLTLWSQTDYTDWQRKFFGGTAQTNNAELNASGGNATTQFLLGGGYRDQKTVYNSKYGLQSGNMRFNLDHNSVNNKFNSSLSVNYSRDKNSTVALDPNSFYNLPPNYSLYKADGSLNWALPNPVAVLLQTLSNQTKNLNANMLLSYKVLPGLTLKTSLGYTDMRLNQLYLSPRASRNPNGYDPLGSAAFANNMNSSKSMEPQADYVLNVGKSNFHALVGGTFIYNSSSEHRLTGYQYKNDNQLENISAAGIIDTLNTASKYKILSGFTRLSYDYDQKYLLNVTLRRDGSSRFGPDRQFGNFWSAGAAWIFTEEAWIKENLPVLSFGKIRGSYGITGNDNVGDYQYFVNYVKTYANYQTAGLYPNNLYNPGYQWEVNKKLDAALDLGFLKDRITLSIDYYRNISSNQLVSYPLATQSGLSSVVQNLDATIQNTGWEVQLNAVPIKNKDFKWSTAVNLTVARNKLLAFPNLASSSYADIYTIGQSVSLIWGYRNPVVDPKTGILHVDDINKDGVITYPEDYASIGNNLPSYYGGFNNSFSYQNFQLDIFFSFKETGKKYFTYLSLGSDIRNQPSVVLGRWQQPGDVTSIPAYTTNSNVVSEYNSSTASMYNASYLRLSSLSLSYSFPRTLAARLGMQNLSLYTMGNNIFTVTSYPGLDPETGTSMPTLRTITFGLRTTF